MYKTFASRIVKSILSMLLVFACACQLALASNQQNTVIRYDGSVLPDTAPQPFQYLDSVTGSRIISDGFLSMSVSAQSGSINNIRYDPFLDTDSAVFQFRTKVDSTLQPLSGVIPGAVVQLRWGGQQSGALNLFVTSGELKLNKGGINNPE